MKVTVDQISSELEEEISLRCHDPASAWVRRVLEVAQEERSLCVHKEGRIYRVKLSDIYYFEVVDGRSFLYTQGDVYEAKEKLYEFEHLCEGSTLFRCSKSMVLNTEKIDYVRPSLSGRFEAVLSSGEKVMISRRYVAELKRILGM